MEETPAVEGQGLDYIINIDNGDFVRKLAAAIDSNNVQEKTERLNQLNELCHHSAEGHAKVIQIIEQLREIKKTRYCYGWLVSELNKAGSSAYRCSLLSLINSIINLSEQLDNRRRIRNELIGYRILDALKDTRKECESDGQTLVELTAFEQSRDKDEEHLTAIEDVDLSSHLDVFYAIFKQVSGTPQEIQFLSILQHLLQVDTTDSLSDVIWENVDRFVTKAALVDGRLDAERLQVEAKRRLDRSVLSTGNCDRSCQCICHSAEAIDATNPDNPLSPSGIRRRNGSIKSGNVDPAAPAPPPPPPPPPPPLPPALPPLGPRLSGVRQLPSAPPDAVPEPPPPPPPAGGSLTPRQLKPAASSTLDCVDNSGGTEACALRLPQQQTPVPKWRMKKLQWSKIPASKVVGKKNVWTTVGTVFSNYSLNFSELEELFGISESGPNASAAVESKDPCVHSDKKKKSDEINLLDSKRSLNVNIFLRQFRISHAEIITCLTTGEGNLISPEKLRGLQKILPEQDDIEALKAFDGDRKKLGTAEKFYLELIQLPNYKLRTDALLIREEFVQTVDYIRTSIDAIMLTAKDIRDNKSVLEIIFMVLMAGNFLNSGGYGGDAAGFKLASLLKLTETNSNKPGMTLLHYVVSAATQKNPMLLKLPEELKYLKEAAQYSVESLTQDIVSLRGKLKAISDQMPNAEESFRDQMRTFLQDSSEEMENLERDLKEMETLRLQLAEYFCEEEKTFKLDDCVKTFASFVDRFQKAIQENEQKEKAAQRKRQQDKSGARTLSSDPSSVNPSPATVSKYVVDDCTGGQLAVVGDTRGRVAGPGGRGRAAAASVSPHDWPSDPFRSSIRMRDRKSAEEGSSLRPRSLDDVLCIPAGGGAGAGGVAAGGEDKRQRQSAEVEKNDLFNYLLQSEDTLGDFDRMGSLRKSCRRRPKTPLLEPETIGGSRERTVPSPSPATGQTPTASSTHLEPNHKSWRTIIEKTSPVLETDLIRVPHQRLGVSNQTEMNTRRSVSNDASESARDSARVRDWNATSGGDNRRGSSDQKINEICNEITLAVPRYISGGSELASSADPGGSRYRRTTTELKDLDYLINDLEQTGRDIERDLAKDSCVAPSTLRGEGDGAPQKPIKQDNYHQKIVTVGDSASIHTGARKEGKEMLDHNGFSGWNSDSARSKAAPMDDLKRRIANYKLHDASCESSVSEAKSRSRPKTSVSREPARQDDVRAVDEHPSVTVADEGVTPPPGGSDSSPVTKRWGRVFESQTTDAQQDVDICQYDHQDNQTIATETIAADQEPSAAAEAAVVGGGSVDGALPTNSDFLQRNERRARSATFEVSTSGVKLRQEPQRGSGTSINQTTSADNATTTTEDQLVTGSLSSADDEGYSTMSNRSSTQTSSIASFEEKLTESDKKMLSLWDRTQDSPRPTESLPGSVCDLNAALPSSAPVNGDQQGSAGGGTDEPEESKTGTLLFARSIDSLVLKGELVPSSSTIDIEAPEEKAPSATTLAAESVVNVDACSADDAVDTESQSSSDQVVVNSSRPRRATLTREIRVLPEPVRSRASSQTRSPVPSSKSQRTSVSDLTDRLSRPKKQTTLAAKTLTASSSSVSSQTPPPPKNPSSARPDLFVRASPGRATLPASVFNANKKKAAAAADHLDSPPVPPQRTTSIRASAASDRLSKGLPTTSSHSRRPAEPSALAAANATTARKASGNHAGHSGMTGATDGCADEGSTAHSKADKPHSSFIRKIVQKNPIRKAAAREDQTSGGLQRPSKPGMAVSSRLSKF